MIVQKDNIQGGRYFLVLLISILFGCYANGQVIGSNKLIGDREWNLLQDRMEEAIRRYKFLAEAFDSRETIPSTGKGLDIEGTEPSGWVSGFFPGTLWYIYEYTGDEYWKSMAERYTARLAGQRYNTHTHDLGFMMYCSYGNGYRLTGDPDYREILLTSARSLSSRYNPVVGSIRSWDFPGWWEQYPVIIDNMMNLELLMWASKASGIEEYEKIALNHSMKTIRNHYRSDFSCYHVVDYNSSTGQPLKKGTHQGAFDESSWARGQAWGLYGFIMMFRESGNKVFLDHASRIADYLLSELEEDPIPSWDFCLMDDPGEEKDASSAAIISSALVELYKHTGDERYLTTARRILIELSTPHYSGGEGEVGGFLLKHSVASKPANVGVDFQLNYTDYYFIEAILRLSHLGFQIEPGDPPNRSDIPEFFKSDLTAIEEEVSQVSRGEVKVIARSPGGFPVYAVFYGKKEELQSRANYNSAIGAQDPSSYAKRDRIHKPVVYFLGPVHGQEMEGIVGLVNLIHIAETGKDYRGKEWNSLKQKLEKCRAIIVPCGNPDGRARCPYDTFLGLPTRIMTKYGQGTHKDGSPWGWPQAKSLHPMQGDVGILGAYFNDDGINIMHDEFFSPMAEETRAILDLARDEAPDLAVSLHSFELVSRILPISYLPWYMKEEVQELSRLVNQNYRSNDLCCYPDEVFGEPSVEDREFPPMTPFNLTSALHHTSGCLVFTFECSHGSFGNPLGNPDITFEDILDYQLILYETMIDYTLEQQSAISR